MKDTTYLKRMIALTQELERNASAEPYDPDSYNRTVEALKDTNRAWRTVQILVGS